MIKAIINKIKKCRSAIYLLFASFFMPFMFAFAFFLSDLLDME